MRCPDFECEIYGRRVEILILPECLSLQEYLTLFDIDVDDRCLYATSWMSQSESLDSGIDVLVTIHEVAHFFAALALA